MVNSHQLAALASACCRAVGADSEIADIVADHLVRADLSGHPSHGVARLPAYIALAESRDLDAGAHPRIIRETASAALFDAGHGFGQFSTRVALDWALAVAERDGIAFATIRHSGHIGRLGEYAELAATRGDIAIVTVGMAGDGVGAVIAPGTARRFLGANPWAFGLPSAEGDHVVVDVSTAVVAEGKILVQAARGEPLPEGWAVDRHGDPTTDPAAYADGGGMLSLGNPTAAHKGFGLGLASALIGGLGSIDDDDLALAGATVADDADPRGRIAGVSIIAISPTAVTGTQSYPGHVDALLASLRRVAPSAVVPGEPERGSRQRQGTDVNLPVATLAELRATAAYLGVGAGALDA
jgi:uncharacterized oxidoreductase